MFFQYLTRDTNLPFSLYFLIQISLSTIIRVFVKYAAPRLVPWRFSVKESWMEPVEGMCYSLYKKSSRSSAINTIPTIWTPGAHKSGEFKPGSICPIYPWMLTLSSQELVQMILFPEKQERCQKWKQSGFSLGWRHTKNSVPAVWKPPAPTVTIIFHPHAGGV